MEAPDAGHLGGFTARVLGEATVGGDQGDLGREARRASTGKRRGLEISEEVHRSRLSGR